VQDGVNHDFRVRAAGSLREVSLWTEFSDYLVLGKSEKPANVGTLSFTDPILSWPKNTEKDLAGYIVRYQSSASDDWATATPAHDSGFLTETQFDVSKLVGNLTRLLVKSVDTTGNEATAATTIVVDLRPAAVTFFAISAQPDGTRELAWGTSPIPARFAGTGVRYLLGATSDWDAMTPLHTGLLIASPFETNQLAAGTYTFAIKNVDLAGNKSEDATFIDNAILPDPRIAGSIEDIIEEPAWEGTKVDCHISGAKGWLIADDTGDWTDPATWAEMTSWIGLPSSPITYTRHIDVGVITTFIPLVTVNGDETITIEERHSDDDASYSSFAAVGPQLLTRYIDIRVTSTGTFPKLKNMRTILSAKPIEEIIENIDVSALTGAYRIGTGDFRLPITQPFTVIKFADITMQSVGAGWTKDGPLDKDTSVGPHFKTYDNGTPADPPSIDAFIRGV